MFNGRVIFPPLHCILLNNEGQIAESGQKKRHVFVENVPETPLYKSTGFRRSLRSLLESCAPPRPPFREPSVPDPPRKNAAPSYPGRRSGSSHRTRQKNAERALKRIPQARLARSENIRLFSANGPRDKKKSPLGDFILALQSPFGILRGGDRIRTCDAFRHTRFPSERTRPLCDASCMAGIPASGTFSMLP